MTTREEAEQELRGYATTAAGRDQIVRRALVAGVTKHRVHQLTGIARTTIDRIATWTIMASDGTEDAADASQAAAAWFITDGDDGALDTVPFRDGDTISDALARFRAADLLPDAATISNRERMWNPYPWQPKGYEYRWTATVNRGAASTEETSR